MTASFHRRHLLALAAVPVLLRASMAQASETPAAEPPPPGKPGDFDFLTGEWKIKNHMQNGDIWIDFDGEATVTPILAGIGSVEELRIPARKFSGMGLRLLDVGNAVWYDYWVNAQSGVLGSAGVPGYFKDGEGIFDSTDPATPLDIWRGVWDRITGDSHRWHQAVSKDGGKTWDTTWEMTWTRA